MQGGASSTQKLPSKAYARLQIADQVLPLLPQAYAPLTAAAAGREIAERAVYVFACAKEGCGVQPECWRAVRAQSPAPRQCQQPAISARKASVLNASQAEEDSKGGIDWGLNQINTWGSAVGWGASQHGCMGEPGLEEGNTGDQLSSGGAFDFNDLDSALDGLVVQTTASIGPSQPQNQAIVSEAGKQAQGGGGTASNKLQCVVGLPEFHIFAELEPGKVGAPQNRRGPNPPSATGIAHVFDCCRWQPCI